MPEERAEYQVPPRDGWAARTVGKLTVDAVGVIIGCINASEHPYVGVVIGAAIVGVNHSVFDTVADRLLPNVDSKEPGQQG